jgi:hypothetical protein
MAQRAAHLVGSLPGDDAAEAMRLAYERLGDALPYLPDGETGERRNWIVSMIEGLRTHPDLEVARDGDWSGYGSLPRLRVRRGHPFYGASIELGIADAARRAWPEFTALGTRAGFQVGIPGDIDLAAFTFGPSGLLRRRSPFAEALVATMREIHRRHGDDVLFQLELPAEVSLLARAPERVRPVLAGRLGHRVAALAQGAPDGARFGLHLCLGDLNHEAFTRIADTRPLVLLANAIAAHWPERRPLRFVHLPLAEAAEPPTDAPAFYRPLSGLRLGPDVTVVAGFAHEGQDLATQLRIRRIVEDAVGAPVAISTSCGLGRRTRAAGIAALDRTRLLLEDTPGPAAP